MSSVSASSSIAETAAPFLKEVIWGGEGQKLLGLNMFQKAYLSLAEKVLLFCFTVLLSVVFTSILADKNPTWVKPDPCP